MKKSFSVIALVKEVWPTVYSELKAFPIFSQNVARHACKGNEPYTCIYKAKGGRPALAKDEEVSGIVESHQLIVEWGLH